MNNTGWIVCIGLLGGFYAKAQHADSLLQLNEVTITSSRFEQFNTGSKSIQTDSVAGITFHTQSLAELLAIQSQVFIKSYGKSLATSSFRGASAEHTAVLWKGFNLQNPMTSQVDFSLINNDAADHIRIQYGGNGALFGSGAVGGVIELNTKAHYNTGVHASAGIQAGSFEHARGQATFSYGNKKWYTSMKWFRLQVQNNFSFINTSLPGKPLVKQANANVAQQGFLDEHYIKLTPNQELNISFWYQYSNRQLPPSMSIPLSKAYQQDESYRTTAEWKFQRRRVLWMARTALFDETINYDDPIKISADVDSSNAFTGRNHAVSSISEVETRIVFSPKYQLNVGLNNTYVNAFSQGYKAWYDQNRTALFASFKMNEPVRNLVTTVSVRQEIIAGILTPVMPSLGAEWKAKKRIRVFGNVSRSYRIPTFNEKYWITGINTNIRPETGWSQELSIAIQPKANKITSEWTLTGFNRNMRDLIVWRPAGGMVWAPENYKKVWSRGAEASVKIIVPFAKWQLKYQGAVNYVLSTNTETALPDDDALNKQLIYVPRITQQHQLTAVFSSYYIGYLHTYTGLQFTATDNSAWIDDYMLGTLIAGKELTWKHYTLLLTFQVNNLFNATYQAMADRPMPGRNFLTTITFKI